VILIGSKSDIDIIPENIFKDQNSKVFSFDFETHQELESKKIVHEIADNMITQNERMEIFDKMIQFNSWHSKIPSTDYEFKNVNLLKLIDSNEFYMFFLPKLINSVLIKKIIEKESPSKIFLTSLFSSIVKSILKEKKIETKIFQNPLKESLLWDTIPIKYNLGKLNFSFNLSKKNYLKIKNFVEETVSFLYRLRFSVNDKKKTILFLEFNPQSFSKFFSEIKDFDGNIVLINQRRSAIWSKKSFDVVRKSNCKILKLDKILTKNEQNEIISSHIEFSKKINNLWNDSEFFKDLFQFNNISFWDIIKEYLIQIYSERLLEHMKLIACITKFFNDTNISCIACLNEVGETEKSFLEINKNKSPLILLEHGFNDKNDSVSFVKRYDVLASYNTFHDKIAVWGEMKKKYLIDNYGIDPERIIVTGSPRHDIYFSSRNQVKNKEKIFLLAPNPITEIDGLSTTELKLRFNELIRKTIECIKKLDNVKLIVKLHPFPLKHNDEIKCLINKIDEQIPIYFSHSVIDTINSSDVVMVVSPEPGTTTMLLESMILGKPTINVYFEEDIPKFNHVKYNSVFSTLDNSDIEKNLKKILFDESFQNELIQNADNFISKYMNYVGDSSKTFANILKSF